MKFLLTFIFAQLSVGILHIGYTADARDPSDEQVVVYSFASLLEECNMNNGFEDREFETNKIREKCTRNGGPNAYDDAKRALQNLRNAISPMINETLHDPALHNYQSWNAEANIATICRIAQPLRNLTMTASETIGSCLNEGERHTANTTLNGRLSFIEFACEDNGRRFLSFWRANGFQCLRRDTRDHNCSENSYGPNKPKVTYSIDINNPVERVGPPWYYETFHPSLHECQQHEAFRNCTVQRLKKCEKMEISEIVDSAIQAVEKVVGCDSLLKAQGTSAAGEHGNSKLSDQRENETISRDVSTHSATI